MFYTQYRCDVFCNPTNQSDLSICSVPGQKYFKQFIENVFCHVQVAILDLDVCGPSMPRVMGLLGEEVSCKYTLICNVTLDLKRLRGFIKDGFTLWTL